MHQFVIRLFLSFVAFLAGASAWAGTPQSIGAISFLPSALYVATTATASATATSGLTVSFSSLTTGVCSVSGSTVTGVSVGTCTIAADQAGDASYLAASTVTQSLVVAKQVQTITSIIVNGQLVNPLSASQFSIYASASSGLTVAFSSLSPGVCTVSGSAVTLVASGTCNLQASQPGDSTYLAAANDAQSFAVGYPQAITFNSLPAQAVGASPFTVNATASSGLAVAFTSLTPAVCSLSGSTVTLLTVGNCSLQASQPGDSNYAAASPVVQAFTIVAFIDNGEVPLPPWAYAALAALLLGGMAAQRRRR